MRTTTTICQWRSEGRGPSLTITGWWGGSSSRAWTSFCLKNASRISTFWGEEAHREMLEAGWRAYDQVPRHVKLALGLLFRDEDDGEGMVDGVNGVSGMNGFH